MNSQFIRALLTGGLLVALSLGLPTETRAQRSGVEVWEANCGRCHLIHPTDKYEAKDWRSLGVHMGIYARLTTAQRDAVITFLVSGARTAGTERDEQEPVPASAAIALSEPLGLDLSPSQIRQLGKYLVSFADVPPDALTRTNGP